MEQDIKVLFQHLHKELVEYQVRFIDISLKSCGLVLLILGWLITSESARVFIATNINGRLAAVIGVSLMEIAYIFIAVRFGWVMQHLGHEMDLLEYMPRSYYGYRVLPPKVIFMTGLIVVAPGAVAIALMLLVAR
jgi:hypothetical protein